MGEVLFQENTHSQKPPATLPAQAQKYGEDVLAFGKSQGMKSDNVSGIIKESNQQGKFEQLTNYLWKKAEQRGETKDQFTQNFSTYLKQLGFNIGVELLKQILDGRLTQDAIQTITQQIMQQYAQDDAKNKKDEQDSDNRERFDEIAKKADPKSDGIEHQP